MTSSRLRYRRITSQLKSPADEPTPDVWWGEDGIDALLWADAEPYAYPPKERPTDGSRELTDGLA